MSDLNKVMLIGRAGRDPETRYTQSGEPIVSFSLATSEQWKDRNGDKQERTEWHKVEVWGKLAEIARDYVSKGRQLYVEGMVRYEEWQDKDGNKRQTTKIRLSGPKATLVLLGKADGQSTRARTSGDGGAPDDDLPIDDDCVPFGG